MTVNSLSGRVIKIRPSCLPRLMLLLHFCHPIKQPNHHINILHRPRHLKIAIYVRFHAQHQTKKNKTHWATAAGVVVLRSLLIWCEMEIPLHRTSTHSSLSVRPFNIKFIAPSLFITHLLLNWFATAAASSRSGPSYCISLLCSCPILIHFTTRLPVWWVRVKQVEERFRTEANAIEKWRGKGVKKDTATEEEESNWNANAPQSHVLRSLYQPNALHSNKNITMRVQLNWVFVRSQ